MGPVMNIFVIPQLCEGKRGRGDAKKATGAGPSLAQRRPKEEEAIKAGISGILLNVTRVNKVERKEKESVLKWNAL